MIHLGETKVDFFDSASIYISLYLVHWAHLHLA